tara:strand:+ start:635 stop:1354 length:720 start_codon:yes stop_codon:yes gene_type:complete
MIGELLPGLSETVVRAIDGLYVPMIELETCMPNVTDLFVQEGMKTLVSQKTAYDSQPNDLLRLFTIQAELLEVLNSLSNAEVVHRVLTGMRSHVSEVQGCVHILSALDPISLKSLSPVLDTWLFRTVTPLVDIIINPIINSLATLFIHPIEQFTQDCPTIAVDFQTVTGPILSTDALGDYKSQLSTTLSSLEIVNHPDKLSILIQKMVDADVDSLSTCVAALMTNYNSVITTLLQSLIA